MISREVDVQQTGTRTQKKGNISATTFIPFCVPSRLQRMTSAVREADV